MAEYYAKHARDVRQGDVVDFHGTRYEVVSDIAELDDTGHYRFQWRELGIRFVPEAVVAGVRYVTVVSAAGDPLEYEISAADAHARYDSETMTVHPRDMFHYVEQ
jgi:hypothetical protein